MGVVISEDGSSILGKSDGIIDVPLDIPLVRSNIENNGLGSVILTTGAVINGVKLWLDFTNEDHYTFDGSNLVEQVNDISGYDKNATQSAPENRGSYSEELIDGNGGLVLDSSGGKSLNIGTVSDFKFLSNGSPAIIFLVLKRTNSSGEQDIFIFNCLGGLTNGFFIGTEAENIKYFTRNLQGSGTLDDTILSTGDQFTYETFHRVAGVFRGLSVPGIDKEIYVDNFETAVASVDDLSATIDNGDVDLVLQIGGFNNTTMDICEAALINPELSDIDDYILKLKAYCDLKYPSI